KKEAARYGVAPLSSEIVGLIPKKALESAAEWFLQVENFDSSLILENRLAAVMGGKMAIGGLRAGVEPFVEQLAAPTATPGGGSAAAAAGAMAAGLAHMVAAMSRGKKAYLQHENVLSAAIARLAQLREDLKAAVDADAASYNAVMKAYKQAREAADGDAILVIPRISRGLIITEVRPSSFSSTPREQESKTCGGGQVQVFPGPRLASKERTRTWGTLAPGQVSNPSTVLLYFSLSQLAAG